METPSADTARFPLANVYWIGGPPDAGKTTVADLVAEWFGVDVYKQDRHELGHLRRADPCLHPLNAALGDRVAHEGGQRAFFQTWVDQGPESLRDTARAVWEERIGLVREDLLAFDPARPVIAEGPGFFPNVIVPLLADRRHAIWLIPTEAFKRASHERRGKSGWRFETSDPARALAHHVARDLLFAKAYREELDAADLPWIEVDGVAGVEAIARRVASHFGFA